ncbi:unnamed protein product [Pleuronectes platessa]|uniref:Uncharacterized protein n=1 Tax=Pleuronectes platessa TaxID=8262 RepID=A0A9N7V3N8_PLEPL|nr:unnamed protein product [Pleuronectes platessa]
MLRGAGPGLGNHRSSELSTSEAWSAPSLCENKAPFYPSGFGLRLKSVETQLVKYYDAKVAPRSGIPPLPPFLSTLWCSFRCEKDDAGAEPAMLVLPHFLAVVQTESATFTWDLRSHSTDNSQRIGAGETMDECRHKSE